MSALKLSCNDLRFQLITEPHRLIELGDDSVLLWKLRNAEKNLK